jgi:predicted Zn-ribbon and HTH transcriptional regulator
MINLDFSSAVSLYLSAILVAVALVWVLGRKQKEKNLALDPRFTWFCSICTYTYINTREETISVCPRCGSYNKR